MDDATARLKRTPVGGEETSFTASPAFSILFDAEITPISAALIRERHKLELRARIAQIAIMLVAAITIAANIGLMMSGSEHVTIGFGLSFLLFGAAFGNRKVIHGHLVRLKEKVVPSILAHYGDFSYTPKPPRSVFKEMTTPELLPSFNGLRIEDFICGTYHGHPVSMLDTTLTQKSRDRSKTVFSGLVIKTPSQYPFTGSYALYPNSGTSGRYQGYFRNLTAWETIKLESSDFEDHFDFLGSDQMEGRTIFTPARMEKWYQFSQAFASNSLSAIFKNGTIFIAYKMPQNWIDGGILSQPADELRQQVAQVARDIHTALRAVDILIHDQNEQPGPF
ncbi:MAG: DUF3137 domain-containing protein [Alphaproteobacteria bacterium]